jgi:hypothetical protein
MRCADRQGTATVNAGPFHGSETSNDQVWEAGHDRPHGSAPRGAVAVAVRELAVPGNPIKGQLLKILGPADGWDNPLVGTQYDPVVRQKIETKRQHKRWARHEARRDAHAERRHSRPQGVGAQPERQEHSTADGD